jgi:hypothetical protein
MIPQNKQIMLVRFQIFIFYIIRNSGVSFEKIYFQIGENYRKHRIFTHLRYYMYYLEHDMHSNTDFIIVKIQIFKFVIIRNSGSLEKLFSDC